MSSISDSFKINFIFLKLFGLWPGKEMTKRYKYYSMIFIFITLFMYNSLLIFNLLYTPRNIELMIREVIFLFTEIAVMGKVFMILYKRKKLLAVFDILDCDHFQGEDDVGRQIVHEHVSKYKTYWKIYGILSNFAYSSQVFLPIFVHLIFKTNLELPICKYYFLDVNVVQKYFIFLFVYQSFGMYGHMTYNVNVDTLIAGLILMAITQLRVLNHEFRNLKVDPEDFKESNAAVDRKQIVKLNRHLKHYDILLTYCSTVQDIMNITMFVQFGMASAIICVILCGLLLPSTTEFLVFMVSYLFAMILQIFVPAWLGTQLIYESQDLAFAAYSSEWIPRSEQFKRSIRLFVERANTHIQLTGCRMFPLSLDTFTSILKTAYSFFTLIRNIQERE
ncbi:odorant receptor Or1-like [Epargyreus clarus]|uniref:odorant receptor Or1-like n=1 Tax=Epargyreus clarus TaxID=520877 RepID=UPI003C2D3F02